MATTKMPVLLVDADPGVLILSKASGAIEEVLLCGLSLTSKHLPQNAKEE